MSWTFSFYKWSWEIDSSRKIHGKLMEFAQPLQSDEYYCGYGCVKMKPGYCFKFLVVIL